MIRINSYAYVLNWLQYMNRDKPKKTKRLASVAVADRPPLRAEVAAALRRRRRRGTCGDGDGVGPCVGHASSKTSAAGPRVVTPDR